MKNRRARINGSHVGESVDRDGDSCQIDGCEKVVINEGLRIGNIWQCAHGLRLPLVRVSVSDV